MDQYIGRRLDGRYELQRVIGVGGMAIVYKALDTLTNMPVAVKMLKEEYLDNEEICRRFRNESKAISLLKHRNIVKIYDVSDSSEYLFIVMEFVDGVTLKDYIRQQGVLSWKETVHFTAQILRALEHAHKKGIVHRDIKPQNIMLQENGDIKVMDFGIARIADYDNEVAGNQAIGSAHYISPEQARGAQTDARADLYSVGVMMYEMLTGKLPFDGKDPVSVAVMHLQVDPRMPREINPSIPEGLEEIVMQAMQKEPERRYQTASEMLMDIEDFKHDPNIKFEYRYMVDDSPTRYINAINVSRRMQDEVEVEKSPVIPVLSGIAVAFILIFLVMAWLVLDASHLFSGNETGQRKMPNFVGMEYQEIINNPDYGFSFIIQWEFNSDYKQNTVFIQRPLPDKEVYDDTQVTLTVSKGVERLLVPEYDKMTYSEYSEICLNLGLRTTKIEVYDDTIAEGKIKNTSPLPRSDIKEGDTVEVYVSLGEKPSVLYMPNFQNMTVNEANARLSALGIAAATTESIDSNKPEGTIISQTPEPGTQISESQAVKFIISNGKAPTGTVELQIALPIGLVSQSLRVEVYIGATLEFMKDVNPEESTTVDASITGTGTNKTAQIFINGALYQTVKINFETGEMTDWQTNPEYLVPSGGSAQKADDR